MPEFTETVEDNDPATTMQFAGFNAGLSAPNYWHPMVPQPFMQHWQPMQQWQSGPAWAGYAALSTTSSYAFVPLVLNSPCVPAAFVGGEALAVQGQVWQMARESEESCRKLQEVIDQVGNADGEMLAEELKGNVLEAINCKHANHVLQRLIVTLRSEASEFIIKEIEFFSWDLARHPFGCRIMQRLLEHCRKEQLQPMVESILLDAKDLCEHPFGNYVAQHILQHGTPEQQHRLSKVIQGHVKLLASSNYALAVVDKALCFGSAADQVAVARAVLNQKGLLVTMACSRHGQDAVQHLLKFHGYDERNTCHRVLSDNLEDIKRRRYGRVVAKLLTTDGRSSHRM